jgi:hypothetical protein
MGLDLLVRVSTAPFVLEFPPRRGTRRPEKSLARFVTWHSGSSLRVMCLLEAVKRRSTRVSRTRPVVGSNAHVR